MIKISKIKNIIKIKGIKISKWAMDHKDLIETILIFGSTVTGLCLCCHGLHYNKKACAIAKDNTLHYLNQSQKYFDEGQKYGVESSCAAFESFLIGKGYNIDEARNITNNLPILKCNLFKTNEL